MYSILQLSCIQGSQSFHLETTWKTIQCKIFLWWYLKGPKVHMGPYCKLYLVVIFHPGTWITCRLKFCEKVEMYINTIEDTLLYLYQCQNVVSMWDTSGFQSIWTWYVAIIKELFCVWTKLRPLYGTCEQSKC